LDKGEGAVVGIFGFFPFFVPFFFRQQKASGESGQNNGGLCGCP
jgi:hypothetical protein